MALALAGRLLMVLLLAGTGVAAPPPPQVSPSEATVDSITAIYNFGDSISDTGNLLREGDTGMLRYTTGLPYGVTIGRPTGRCSDGFLMIDFLAEDLGLPLLNPYLDRRADFTHGVNFAVAGATTLSTTALANRGLTVSHTNSSLGVQLRWFKEFMSSTTNSPREIDKKLASSLVMLGEIGGNDYNYVFLQPRRTNDRHDPISNATRSAESLAHALSLVPEVVQSVADAAKEVLDMGATRMVIPGNFPIGCMPSYLTAATASSPASLRDGDGCLVSFNVLARAHNERLRRAVGELRRSYRTRRWPTPTTSPPTSRSSATRRGSASRAARPCVGRAAARAAGSITLITTGCAARRGRRCARTRAGVLAGTASTSRSMVTAS
ncbi:hypothetical protein VPH35_003084 [Triticum aestivum]